MKKIRQILALACVALLLTLYVLTLIFSFFKSEWGQTMFRASLGTTILLPILLWVFLMVTKNVRPSKSPLIDAVVFDVGGVLMDFPWETYAETLGWPEETIKALEKPVIHSERWADFDVNNEPYETILEKFVSAAPPQYEKEARQFITTINDCISVCPYTKSWLSDLTWHGYKVYLLSNWGIRSYTKLREDGRMDFVDLTDGAVWSFNVHCRKPEEKIFNILKNTYRLDPQRTVFIDDNKTNTDAAKKLGYNAITFTDFESAKRGLHALGVK